jgi:hypothetical protein
MTSRAIDIDAMLTHSAADEQQTHIPCGTINKTRGRADVGIKSRRNRRRGERRLSINAIHLPKSNLWMRIFISPFQVKKELHLHMLLQHHRSMGEYNHPKPLSCGTNHVFLRYARGRGIFFRFFRKIRKILTANAILEDRTGGMLWTKYSPR